MARGPEDKDEKPAAKKRHPRQYAKKRVLKPPAGEVAEPTPKPKKRATSKPRKKPSSSTGRGALTVVDQTGWRQTLQASRIKFDEIQKGVYINELAEHGRKGDAARAAGVTRKTVSKHLGLDPDFAELAAEAVDHYRDKVATEVRRRGQEGWLEPVYQKGERVLEPVLDEDGNVIYTERAVVTKKKNEDGTETEETKIIPVPLLRPASVRKFSDALLLAEARRVDPTYRDKQPDEGNANTGGVMVRGPRLTEVEQIAEGEAANQAARLAREEKQRAAGSV